MPGSSGNAGRPTCKTHLDCRNAPNHSIASTRLIVPHIRILSRPCPSKNGSPPKNAPVNSYGWLRRQREFAAVMVDGLDIAIVVAKAVAAIRNAAGNARSPGSPRSAHHLLPALVARDGLSVPAIFGYSSPDAPTSLHSFVSRKNTKERQDPGASTTYGQPKSRCAFGRRPKKMPSPASPESLL